MVWSPQVRRIAREGGGERLVVGHRLVDEFLEFAASRARPNTVRAYAHDLKAFFAIVAKEPVEVRPADVMGFVTAQRRPRPGTQKVVRISDGELVCRVRRSADAWPRCRRSRVSDRPRRRGGGDEPGPAGFADAAVSIAARLAWSAAGAGGAPTAAHLGSRRAGRADRSASHR